MMTRNGILAGGMFALLVAGNVVDAADSWPKRMYDLQNTSNVGEDPALTKANAPDLVERRILITDGVVNATPIVSEAFDTADGSSRLVFVGDAATKEDGERTGYFYVIDVESGQRLVQFDTGASVSTPLVGHGVQSTALLATVDVPEFDANGNRIGSSGEQERRVYFGANKKPDSFWCLNVDAIIENRQSLMDGGAPDPGTDFFCEGADWPIMIAGLGNVETNELNAPLPVYNASPIFADDQVVRVGPNLETRDVIYTPTIGADCSDGQLWAIDAYTAEVLWTYDPVPNFQDIVQPTTPASIGYGGVIWTVPALSGDGSHLYVTTGDCVEQPQVGFHAESLVALDPVEGTVQWFHQRRLVDTTDYDIGNSPVVVDVPGENGCHVVVSSDKNGCIYGFRQRGDIPQVGEVEYDPTRPGQQRILWRTCLLQGSINGGFNASAVTAEGRTVFAQSSGMNVPGDDAAFFALDACTGELRFPSANVSSGRAEGAIASGMVFQPSGSRLQVLEATDQENVLATVELGQRSTAGGGGPAVVDGTIYVPGNDGVSIVSVVPGSNASVPDPRPAPSFGGPYPHPIGTAPEQVMMPVDPYDPDSPPAPPVEEWPSMNPELP